MPELPEVETVRQGLERVTLNHAIQGGDVLLPRTISHPISVTDFLSGLKGVTIVRWHRRGKYLLAELSRGVGESGIKNSPCPPSTDTCDGSLPPAAVSPPHSLANPAGWLGVHLRMTGQLLWLDRNEALQKHARVRLFFGEGWELRFVDQRTFGKMWWVPPSEQPENIITGLKKLGPDPFSSEFTIAYLVEKLKNRRTAIKTALLDQELVAGLGNIYADEALFVSRVQPATLCTKLNQKQIEGLHDAIVQVLKTAINAGGTTFSNFLNVQGVNGNYGGVAWVYHRTSEPCRVCSTLVQRLKLAGRSSHFCPQCQK